MEIRVTPTEQITYQGDTALRIWKGIDDEGNPVVALIEALARTDVDEWEPRGILRRVDPDLGAPNVDGLEAVPYHRALRG